MPETNPSNPRLARSADQLNQLEQMRISREETNSREIEGLIVQMKEAQQEVDTALSKLVYLSGELRGKAQRHPTESSHSYLIYANAHLRFAGAAVQGMKRTAATSRILDRAKAEQEDQKRRKRQDQERAEAREKQEEKQKELRRLAAPTDDDFSQLYGEVVDHAD